MEFGKKLNALLDATNTSGKELAKKIGYHEEIISDWLTEKSEPNKKAFQAIARHFGISIKKLMSSDFKIECEPMAQPYKGLEELCSDVEIEIGKILHKLSRYSSKRNILAAYRLLDVSKDLISEVARMERRMITRGVRFSTINNKE